MGARAPCRRCVGRPTRQKEMAVGLVSGLIKAAMVKKLLSRFLGNKKHGSARY